MAPPTSPQAVEAAASALLRATRVVGAGSWPAERALDAVTLAYADRHLRRRRLTTDAGAHLLLDLPRARLLADGDGLDRGDGTWVAVRAAAEPVMEARCDDPRQLARLAWHVGNRHTPAQILDGALRLREDAVLADMLEGLGARVTRLSAPFAPEPGAYAQAHGHGHRHGHAHDHGHDHGQDGDGEGAR